MAVTQNTYTGNGTTVLYSFTFPYLDTSHIKVSINGTLTTAYTLANATTIQFTTAPANGSAIRIYRETDDATLQSTFFAGSAIRAQDLNEDFNQSLYIAQETKDRNVDPNNATLLNDLNMNGYRITSLGSPTASTDAANKAYTDNVILGQIPDGTLTNVKISATAAIAGTKISPDFGSQTISTTGNITTTGNSAAGTSLPNALYRSTLNGDGSTVIGGLSLKSQGTDTLFIGNVGAANNVDSEIWNPQNGYLRFATNNTERLRIDSSGRVGIGTSSPSSLLHVGGVATPTVSATPTSIRLDNTYTGSPAAGNKLKFYLYNDGTEYYGVTVGDAADFQYWAGGGSSGTHRWFTSNTERMRIASTGLVATFSSTGVDSFYSNSTEGAGTVYNLFRGGHSATSTISSTASIRIYTNGNVQNTNNSYGSLSDIKLKENIVDANSQWDDIKALQVRNYNLKEGQTHTQIGLVAQEVEPISPGLVYESPDRDEEGNDLGTVTKSVNYSVLYMKAVKALQEAMERIETLEAKVAALEAPQ